jgi:hypothetical protein
MEKDLEQIRQQRNLALLQSNADVRLGDEQGLPWTLAELAAITGDEDFVVKKIDSGLTAFVYQLRAGDKHYTLKQARPECLVRNVDGQTSFLNELLCRQHIDTLREADPSRLAAVTKTYVASLRHGVLLSEWVHGESITAWGRRKLQQLFAAGSELLLAGLFEWDFCPGNLLDDGEQIRLFDFGYTYPFDPLQHFNSAGNGDSEPLFHLAERFETRNYFAYLLGVEREQGAGAALKAFRLEKEIAADAYLALIETLMQSGATPMIIDWLRSFVERWSNALSLDLYPLYLQEGWRSHMRDLYDDLRGKTCTPMTLQRGEWLLHALEKDFAKLKAMNAFLWDDKNRSQQELLETYRQHYASAQRYQIVNEQSASAKLT